MREVFGRIQLKAQTGAQVQVEAVLVRIGQSDTTVGGYFELGQSSERRAK
jgi:hypothetical protein